MLACMAAFQGLLGHAGAPGAPSSRMASSPRSFRGSPSSRSRTQPCTPTRRAWPRRFRSSRLPTRMRASTARWSGSRPTTTSRRPCSAKAGYALDSEAPRDDARSLAAAGRRRPARGLERRAGSRGGRRDRRAELRPARRCGELVTRRLAHARDGICRTARRPPGCVPHLVREGPDAGVFMVGTVPEARGRGLARRLLLRALRDARAAGSTVSSLQSSRLGYPVYRRLGYVELCRLGMWERGH